MNLIRLFLHAVLLTVFCLQAASAQEMQMHRHDASEKLGQVKFTVSCNAAAKKQFNRATALLHSYWYDEAEKAFAAISRVDPKCGMAHWGIAMSLYHPVWAPASAAELEKGWAAVEKAKTAGVRTNR